MICELVCSSECSNCFFRRNADLAAMAGVSDNSRKRYACELALLVGRNVFSRQRILLIHLILQVLLPLVQQLKLASKLEDGLLWRLLLRLATAKPAQAPAAHVEVVLEVFS